MLYTGSSSETSGRPTSKINGLTVGLAMMEVLTVVLAKVR